MILTPTTPTGVIEDRSILRMLENSLSDGALYRHRDPGSSEGDTNSMLTLLKNFWQVVSNVFSDAWGQPPRRSRLMHGVGIVSLGFVMDAIADPRWRSVVPGQQDFETDLRPLVDVCHWTSGSWEFGPQHQRRWNDL